MFGSKLEPLLHDFSSRWKLGTLSADAEGRYRLNVDGQLEVRLGLQDGALLLEGSPGLLPADDARDPDRLVQLLGAHFADLKDSDAVLALELEGERLILYRRLALADVTLDSFERALESFINQLEHWVTRLSKDFAPAPALGVSPYQIFFP